MWSLKLTVQCDGSEEEDDENEVGEGGGEIDDLSGALDSLDETSEDDEPSGQEGQGQMPLDGAHLLDPGRLGQHAAGQVLLSGWKMTRTKRQNINL